MCCTPIAHPLPRILGVMTPEKLSHLEAFIVRLKAQYRDIALVLSTSPTPSTPTKRTRSQLLDSLPTSLSHVYLNLITSLHTSNHEELERHFDQLFTSDILSRA